MANKVKKNGIRWGCLMNRKIHKRLVDYCHLKKVTQTGVVERALFDYLDGRLPGNI